MAKKKVEKKVSAKVMDNKSCKVNNYVGSGYGCLKIASMAFILFLVTVWPSLGNWLVNVHWGWYLGIFVVFSAIAMNRICCCK